MLTDVMRLTLVVHRLLFDERWVCRDRRCQTSVVEVEAQRGRVCCCREAAREHGGRGPHDV